MKVVQMAVVVFSTLLNNRSPSIITNEVTPRSHDKNPECCLLADERNPVLNNLQYVFVSVRWVGGGGDEPRALRGPYARYGSHL
jgi:hypothetical protein